MLYANAAAQEQALSSARQQQAGAVGMLNLQSTHVFACKASELVTPEGHSSTYETLVAFN